MEATSRVSGRRPAELVGYFKRHPWVWSFLAAAVVWIVTYLQVSRGLFGTLTAAALVGSVLVVVGIGQMFVITAGNGNIDLSIPSTMTLAAFFALGAMNGADGGLAVGLIVAMVIGLVIAVANVLTIFALKVPPIVGTLAVGFIAQSAAFVKSNDFSATPSPLLEDFVNAKILGLPVLALSVVALAIVASLLLTRTRYGRSLQAVGQSIRAARLSGVRVLATVAGAYAISGVLAALGGVLLAASSGGVQVDIATPYLLNSIAVVVLGGSLIEGGRSFVAGVWGAALLLTLLVTLLTVLNIAVSYQNVIKGLLIIAVLSLSGGRAQES